MTGSSDFRSYRYDFWRGFLTTPRRNHQLPVSSRGGGGLCSTLYSCKICGCLLRSRADRKAHTTLQHKPISSTRTHHTRNVDLTTNDQSFFVLEATPKSNVNFSQPVVVTSSIAQDSASASELGTSRFDFLRSSYHPHCSTETLLPSTEEETPIVTSLVGSRDRDSTSGIMSDCMQGDNFAGKYSTTSDDRRSDEVLDLTTTKDVGTDRNLLPVPAYSADNGDFRSSLVRHRKSLGLDRTVQRLWQFKLQNQLSACVDNEVIVLGRRERSMLYDDNANDLGNDSVLLEEAGQTHHSQEERPSLETNVSGYRSPGHAGAELKLRRVVASPGKRPFCYMSLMTLQSTSRRKTLPARKRNSHTTPADEPSQSVKSSSSPRERDVLDDTQWAPSQVAACDVCCDAGDLRRHQLSTHRHDAQQRGAMCRPIKSRSHHVNSSRHLRGGASVTSSRRHSAASHLLLRHRRLQLSRSQAADRHERKVEHWSRGSTIITSCSETGSSASAGGRGVTCEFPGCRRAFRELKHLKVHRMQHTDERPLACTLCTYTCRQRNSLNWHMKSRHGLGKTVTDDGRTVYVSNASSQ